jgi:hypothetical protein
MTMAYCEIRVWGKTEDEIVELNKALAKTHEKPEFKIILLKCVGKDVFCGKWVVCESAQYVLAVKEDVLAALYTFPNLVAADFEGDLSESVDECGVGLLANYYEAHAFKVIGEREPLDELTSFILG